MITNGNEIIELSSPDSEFKFNETLNSFMGVGNSKGVVQCKNSNHSRNNYTPPYVIENDDYIFSIQVLQYMRDKGFDKPLEKVEISGALNTLSHSIIDRNLYQKYAGVTKRMATSYMMNPIITSTSRFIFDNIIAPEEMGPYFTGVKIYEDRIIDEERNTDNSCQIYELNYNNKKYSYILAHFINANLVILYILAVPNEIIPAGLIINHTTVNLFRNEDDILIESYCIPLLEQLNGKEYDKIVIDFSQSINESVADINKKTFILSEGVIRDTVRKVKGKIIQTDKKASANIDKLAADVKETAKKSLLPDAREEIVKDSLPRLSKLIKTAAGLGVTWAINPAIAALGAFTAVVVRRKMKRDERRKILAELREEYEIIEEKIKDAESKGDNKNKYQLMRMRNKIKTSMERIKYGDNFVDGRTSVTDGH